MAIPFPAGPLVQGLRGWGKRCFLCALLTHVGCSPCAGACLNSLCKVLNQHREGMGPPHETGAKKTVAVIQVQALVLVWFGLVVLSPLGFIGGGRPPKFPPLEWASNYPRLHPLLPWSSNFCSPCLGLSDLEVHTAIGEDVGLSCRS